MLSKIAVIVSAAIVLGGVMAGVARVSFLEDHEVRSVASTTLASLRHEGDHNVTLSTVALSAEQNVVFELCADDPMLPERWAGAMAVVIARPSAHEIMTRSELTEDVLAQVSRNETSGCLIVGRGTVQDGGDYAIQAEWEDAPPAQLDDVTLRVRVVGRRPLENVDLMIVFFTWLGSLGLVMGLALRPSPPLAAATVPAIAVPPDVALDPLAASEASGLDEWEEAQARAAPPRKIPGEVRALIGLVVIVLAFVLSSFLPAGAASGLAIGVSLALFESSVAFGLMPGRGVLRRLEGLGLHRPKHWYVHFPFAIVAGVGLVFLARGATALVPSTSTSSIQSFVSWPSGMLSFATLAVVAPLAEEVFFRGFVYGVLEKRSKVLAFLGGWLLFVIAHAPQTWGQWGALVAILVTGLGLTAVRAVSGSTLASGTSHLVYNGMLALSAFL